VLIRMMKWVSEEHMSMEVNASVRNNKIEFPGRTKPSMWISTRNEPDLQEYGVLQLTLGSRKPYDLGTGNGGL